MWDKLESVGGDRSGPPDEGDIQASIAVSLKRIADRMETITTVFGDGSMGQLNGGVEGNINARNEY